MRPAGPGISDSTVVPAAGRLLTTMWTGLLGRTAALCPRRDRQRACQGASAELPGAGLPANAARPWLGDLTAPE
jgi:hypothetical protein